MAKIDEVVDRTDCIIDATNRLKYKSAQPLGEFAAVA